MKIIVKVHAMTMPSPGLNGGWIPPVDHFLFKGNPLCQAVGRLAVRIGLPNLNQHSMAGGPSQIFTNNLSLIGGNLWLSEDSAFRFKREHENVMVDTLPNLLERLETQFAPGDEVIVSNFIGNDEGVFGSGSLSNMSIMGSHQIEIIAEFIPEEKQLVEFGEFHEEWLVSHKGEKGWFGVKLKLQRSGAYTIERNGQVTDIVVHQIDGDYVMQFNPAGMLTKICRKDGEPIEKGVLRLQADHPIFDLIEIDGLKIVAYEDFVK